MGVGGEVIACASLGFFGVEAIGPLPIMEELSTLQTVKELGKAIDSLAAGKAPGSHVMGYLLIT